MVMSFSKGKIFLLGYGLLFSFTLKAQQYTQFSNYLINSVTLNPAYCGSKSGTELMATYRRQWRNIEGSPSTFSASGHGQIGTGKIGLGGILLKDEIGLSKNLYVSTSTSYGVKLKKLNLNFGITGGIQSHCSDYGEIKTVDLNDVVFSENIINEYYPIIGAGIYLFDNSFYFGLSSPDLVESNKGQRGLYQKKRHYYLSAGKIFNVSKILKLKPSVLAKFTSSTKTQFDLSGTSIISDKIGLGLSYRTQTGIVLFTQIFVNAKWTVKYAYDNMTNGLSGIVGSTHEITLIHNLHKSEKTIYSPRYF